MSVYSNFSLALIRTWSEECELPVRFPLNIKWLTTQALGWNSLASATSAKLHILRTSIPLCKIEIIIVLISQYCDQMKMRWCVKNSAHFLMFQLQCFPYITPSPLSGKSFLSLLYSRSTYHIRPYVVLSGVCFPCHVVNSLVNSKEELSHSYFCISHSVISHKSSFQMNWKIISFPLPLTALGILPRQCFLVTKGCLDFLVPY